MKILKNHLFQTLIVIVILCNYSFGQKELELVKLENPIISITSCNDDELRNIIKDLKAKFGEKTTIRIARYASEKNWPTAINSQEKRDNPEVQKAISKYKMYNLGFYKRNIDQKICILFVPKDENATMPVGYKPETDLFFCADQKTQISTKKKPFDINREDILITENYNFLNLSYIIRNNHSKDDKLDLINKNAEGENVYSTTKNTLTGFFENTMVDNRGTLYYSGCYDAGTDLNQARKTYKKMCDQIMSGEFHTCNFTSAPVKKTFELEADEFTALKCVTFPVAIDLSLVDNKNLSNKHKTENGYAITMTIKEKVKEDPNESLWNNLYDNIENEMKSSGYTPLCKFNARHSGFEGKFEISQPKDCKWVIYVSSPDANAEIVDKDYKQYKKLDPPVPFKNIWYMTGNAIIQPGKYDIWGSSKDGRWLLCVGEKLSEAALKEFKDKEKKENDMMENAKIAMKHEIDKIGYTIIEERILSTSLEETYQNVSVYGVQKIQLMIATSDLGLSVDATDEKGNIVSKSIKTEHDGVYYHGLYIEANSTESNYFKINFHYVDTDFHRTFMYISTKK